jgi:hypothetical protein
MGLGGRRWAPKTKHHSIIASGSQSGYELYDKLEDPRPYYGHRVFESGVEVLDRASSQYGVSYLAWE